MSRDAGWHRDAGPVDGQRRARVAGDVPAGVLPKQADAAHGTADVTEGGRGGGRDEGRGGGRGAGRWAGRWVELWAELWVGPMLGNEPV